MANTIRPTASGDGPSGAVVPSSRLRDRREDRVPLFSSSLVGDQWANHVEARISSSGERVVFSRLLELVAYPLKTVLACGVCLAEDTVDELTYIPPLATS